MKSCSMCKRQLELSQFHARGENGTQSRCRDCTNKKAVPANSYEIEDEATLDEIAIELGVSRMGALKILRRAIGKLRESGALMDFA